MRINILDESVFNKIAAGEVVEKPASIVKELVENSLDAGASEILVEIEGGGIDRIRVVDDGEGIHPDDVKPAFITHATSKIKNIEDLSNISTLGFRGEALSSIASVTKLKMQTKQQQFSEGKQIIIEGGIIKDFSDYPMNTGTIVEINDLFYNIPARKKFLRKPKTEETEITNLMSRYILANPHVKFSYIVDGSLIYKTSGTNLEDAIYSVYKKDTLNNLIKVDYAVDNIHIYGYISKPTYSKSNRTYQTLIINHRYVINSLISTCVQNAYENLLMKGQFPLFVLNFDLPYESVDVNVHPNKLDVKFENTQKIYGYFFSSISKALLGNNEIKQVSIFDDNKNFENKNKNIGLEISGKSFQDFDENKDKNNFEEKDVNLKQSDNKEILDFTDDERLKEKLEVLNKFSKLTNTKQDTFCENGIMAKVLKRQLDRVDNIGVNNQETRRENSNNIEEVTVVPKFDSSINLQQENKQNQDFTQSYSTKQQIFESIETLNYKIIGSVFDTYILIEMNNSMYCFDQHACHERLNYDRLVKSLNEKQVSVQPLLVPYIFETNELETAFLEEKLNAISSLGFETSVFGQNCFKISTVPSVLSGVNLKDFINDILQDLSSLKKLTTTDLLKEKLSQKACKASVRAGNKLGKEEIDLLLTLMQQNNMTLSCPHGRPAVIEITKTELEKWFKRKV